MKKRKLNVFKLIKLFVFLFIIAAGVILFKFLFSGLKGEKINNYIYHYTIDKTEDQYVTSEIDNGKIYYMKEKEKIYTIYVRDLKEKNNIKLGTINKEYDYCLFESGYITCSNEENDIDYYDYKLNLKYTKKYDRDGLTNVIRYQGKFVELRDKKIYDNDKVIKELKLDGLDVYYYTDIIIDNTTHPVFICPINNTYIYYNILSDKYEEIPNVLWYRYSSGFFTAEIGKVVIYDMINNEYKELDSPIISEYLDLYSLNNDIFYFVENNKLFALDLNNKIIDEIDYTFDKEFKQIIYNNEYLYLLTYDDNIYDVYVVDIKNAKKQSYSVDDFQKGMDNLVDERITNIENNYHVDVVYKDQVNIDNETFSASTVDNNFKIMESLDTLESVLKKFSIDFFDRFHDAEHNGIIIYLTGPLLPKEGVNTTDSPAGYSLTENNQFEMVVDIEQLDLKKNICHELMHNIEFRLDAPLFSDWKNMNPKGFEYMYSYKANASEKYTISEFDPNSAYFIDTYAKLYPTEDIARTFENICYVEENSLLLDYPHLYEKAIFLKELMLKEFPSLKTATIFNSLDKK